MTTSSEPDCVFISYCRDNLAEVRVLHEFLADTGFRVWWDQDILPGQDWNLEVENALERSAAVIVCFSAESQQRGRAGIYPELSNAVEIFRCLPPGSLFIIPVRVSECELPKISIDATRSLTDLQCIDVFPTSRRESAYERLSRSLQIALGQSKKERLIKDEVGVQEGISQQDIEGWKSKLGEALLRAEIPAADELVSVLTSKVVSMLLDGTRVGLEKDEVNKYPHDFIYERRRTLEALEHHLSETRDWSQSINILGMARPRTLNSIYVQLSLTDDPKRFRLGVKEWDTYSLQDALSQRSSLVILGDPGSGKTTTLKRIALGILSGEYQAGAPLVIRFRDLKTGQSLRQRLIQMLSVDFRRNQDLGIAIRDLEDKKRQAEHSAAQLRDKARQESRDLRSLREQFRSLEAKDKEERERKASRRGRFRLTAEEKREGKERRARLQELRRIIKNEEKTLEERVKDVPDVIEQITFAFREDYSVLETRALAKLLDSIGVTILLDGFDELDNEMRGVVFEEVRELSVALRSTRIILTSRPADFPGRLDNTLMFEINPLSGVQIQKLVHLWFSGEEERKRTEAGFISALEASPYSDLSKRPLTLANLCLVYEKYGSLPDMPISIYRKIINLLLEEWSTERSVERRSRYARFDAHRKRDFLSSLAYELLKMRGSALTFSTYDLEAIYGNISRKFRLPRGEAGEVAEEIESHTGLVVRASYEQYEFSHRSLQEFLVASYLNGLPDILKAQSVLDKCPNELAIALALTMEPTPWFCRLFRNKKERKVPRENWVYPFLSRVLLERPGLEPSAEFGGTILWMLGQSSIDNTVVQDFLNLIPVRESLNSFLAHCVVETSGYWLGWITGSGPSDSVLVTVRRPYDAENPPLKSLKMKVRDFSNLPGHEQVPYRYVERVARLDRVHRLGFIGSGRWELAFNLDDVDGAASLEIEVGFPVEFSVIDDGDGRRAVDIQVVKSPGRV